MMARRKKKAWYSERRAIKGARGISSTSVRGIADFGKIGDAAGNLKYLAMAAEVIAAQAKANAKRFSTRIPASTGVVLGDTGNEVVVITDGAAAPNASPFEFGKRHPRWGHIDQKWAVQPKRPYMAKAARAKSEAALLVYAKQLDEMTEQAGYK